MSTSYNQYASVYSKYIEKNVEKSIHLIRKNYPLRQSWRFWNHGFLSKATLLSSHSELCSLFQISTIIVYVRDKLIEYIWINLQVMWVSRFHKLTLFSHDNLNHDTWEEHAHTPFYSLFEVGNFQEHVFSESNLWKYRVTLVS